MILITHAVVGAALSQVIQNPVASFFLGIISHFILDAVPHYDYADERFVEDPNSKHSKLIFKIIILDGLLGVFLPLWIFNWQGQIQFLNIFLAITGSMLPDALQGVQLYWPNKLTQALTSFHKKVHYLFINKLYLCNFPILGLFLQALVAVSAWYIVKV